MRDFERKAKEGNYHQTWETVGEDKSLKMNVYKAVLHVFDLKKMTVQPLFHLHFHVLLLTYLPLRHTSNCC